MWNCDNCESSNIDSTTVCKICGNPKTIPDNYPIISVQSGTPKPEIDTPKKTGRSAILFFAFVTGASMLWVILSNHKNVTPIEPKDNFSVTSIVLVLPEKLPTPTIKPATTKYISPTLLIPLPIKPTYTMQSSLCVTIDTISLRDERTGDYIQVDCRNNISYDLGPLAKGAYIIGPNRKFLVYCTNDGIVYISRAEDQSLMLLENVVKRLPFFRDNYESRQALSFLGENPFYLIISDKYSAEYISIQIPLSFSQ